MDVALISFLTTNFPSDQISSTIEKNMQLRPLAPLQWIKPACSWNMAIFKIEVFCQSWSIVWDADFSQTRWEVLCPFSLLPDSCNIAACYSNDTAWKIRFPTKQPLPAPTIAWKCPAVDITYCAQRDSKSFYLCPLLHSGMAEGTGVSDFFH